MPMTRRKFLKWAAGAAGVSAAAAGGAFIFRDDLQHLGPGGIVAVLREEFPYLTFTDDDARKFAVQYEAHYQPITRRLLYLARDGNDDLFRDRVDHLATTFLLSTDFFLNGADEQRPLKFVRLHHPYVSPCWNPLAMAGAAADRQESAAAPPQS
jgi:hypothetical protein